MLAEVLWGVRVYRFISLIVANILWHSESKQVTFLSRVLSSLGLTFVKSVFGHLFDGSLIHSVVTAFDPKLPSHRFGIVAFRSFVEIGDFCQL